MQTMSPGDPDQALLWRFSLFFLFLGLIIFGFVRSYHLITDATNSRLVYLAATAKAIELKGSENYRVPVQSDLVEYIG
ncbi:hypothetical protein [Acetobacterium sp.]|uniref:hypothetical protein n=1 Tax=Acetobacterium sp. TaxID=1872094 RepID=UPI0035934091